MQRLDPSAHRPLSAFARWLGAEHAYLALKMPLHHSARQLIQEVSSSTTLCSAIPTCDLSNCCLRYKVQGTKDTTRFILLESRQRCQPGERSGEPGPGTLQAATSQPVKLHQRANPVQYILACWNYSRCHLMLPTVGSIFVYEEQY